MEEETEFLNASNLDPGCMISAEIHTTSYFDTDGKMKYAVNIKGDINLAQALGLIELSKIATYKTYMQDEPYPPDPEETDDDR